jgi:hypothetical protein
LPFAVVALSFSNNHSTITTIAMENNHEGEWLDFLACDICNDDIAILEKVVKAGKMIIRTRTMKWHKVWHH